jgi:pyruvate,water dikinase
MEASGLIRPFGGLGMDSRPLVGGKGASLGELTRAGINVPPGFVVTTEGFMAFLAAIDPEGSIRRDIEALSPDDLVTASRVCEGIRQRIESTPMHPDMEEVISAAHAVLCGSDPDLAAAVRSSATSEDSAEASFAGLQDTYLWVRGIANVLHFVRACWASLYSVESVVYRLRRGLPEDGLAMGVVVQRMVDARISGVMFTRSPTTGDRSVVAVEATWGLGSAVVSGEVTPDKMIVAKVTEEVVSRTTSHKTIMHVPDLNGGGIREMAVPDAQRDLPCLPDDSLIALVRIGKAIEKRYGCPQDIEWAIGPGLEGKDEIFLLQSRPETIWAQRDAKPIAAPAARAFDHVFAVLGKRSGA